jgi:hypothetical protein
MAQEVFRQQVIGNFKPTAGARLKSKRTKSAEKRRKRPGNSNLHLTAIRLCPCIVTLRMPAGEVHHLKSGTNERGTQQRSSDKWGLPMLHSFHMALEARGSRNEIAQLAEWGIEDPQGLAKALWAVRPGSSKPAAMRDAVAAMTRIIFAHCKGTRGGFQE